MGVVPLIVGHPSLLASLTVGATKCNPKIFVWRSSLKTEKAVEFVVKQALNHELKPHNLIKSYSDAM